MLGSGGSALHDALRAFVARPRAARDDRQQWFLHYVTAREMYNVAMAAIDGHSGNPNAYRDHVLPPPPVAMT